MDLREVSDKEVFRHPWELSRTGRILSICGKLFQNAHAKGSMRIANIGAGDTYFDKCYLQKYPEDFTYAVDTGYKDMHSDCANIQKIRDISQINEKEKLDAVLMMDSLEYMEDDSDYLRKVLMKMKDGATLLLTLPAFPFLFSDHDIHVENLRRYNIKSFKALVEKVPGLQIKDYHFFYFSLFWVRFIKKIFKIPIDKNKKITAYWKYREKNFITRSIVAILNIDYMTCWCLHLCKIFLPGLSLLVICEKKSIK